MLGIGLPELVIIIVIALVVLGPERLPELGRQVGTFVRTARRMYSNLRAELGPEFDDIEQGIRELRSLDPRQQMRDYGRALLDDVSADAPEIKQVMDAPKVNLEQLGRNVLGDDLLDKPLAETRTQAQPEVSDPSGGAKENGVVQPPVAKPVVANEPREVETTNYFE
jgi:sec-independent protein translocase protein TatB